ncbi:hypothetical protein [Limnobaculum parvum]|nr:hypothetical protein [Limnobaculum parvum]
MVNFIDNNPLDLNELAFQCVSLIHSILTVDSPEVKEGLAFILREKLFVLYGMVE